MLGRLVAAGNYLFWVDVRNNNVGLYGYNVSTQHEFRILALTKTYDTYNLVSDGQTLAWIDTRLPMERVLGYDLTTAQIFTITTATEYTGFNSIALHDGVLYYGDASPKRRGIYARELATGQEQLLVPDGLAPVVENGILVWQDIRRSAHSSQMERSLYVRKLDGSLGDTFIVSSTVAFSHYALAGAHVVWSVDRPAVDTRVYSYDLATSSITPLSSGGGRWPVGAENRVAWSWAGVSATRRMTQTLTVYDYTTQQAVPLIAESTAIIQGYTFVTPDIVAFALQRDPRSSTNELWLAPVSTPGLRFDTVQVSTAPAVVVGQVQVCDQRLCVGDGVWSPSGVQFLLPARGINSKTFCNSNYASDRTERLFWLNQTAIVLFARTLRIYAYAPGNNDCDAAISPATLLDFAQLASNRGMRIGLVIHNIGMGFTFTQEQRDWLRSVHTAFASTEISGQSALEVLAYINISNEINKYCSGNDDYDCFVQGSSTYTPTTYINEAVAWVRDVSQFIKNDLQSPVLVTVGMSTEARRPDESTGAINFFQEDAQGQRIVDYVDFLSPHNYAGGAGKVMNELNSKANRKPVLLEEYGYPTDPYNNSEGFPGNSRTEGPFEANCGVNPIEKAQCARTAPFFVKSNILDMQSRGYAGGIAFMVADMDERQCGRVPNLYTGLFTEGDSNYGCNGQGTYTRGKGTLKTTGRIVRDFHAPFIICLPIMGR